MNQYDHNKIEKKWQNVWEKKKPNKVKFVFYFGSFPET